MSTRRAAAVLCVVPGSPPALHETGTGCASAPSVPPKYMQDTCRHYDIVTVIRVYISFCSRCLYFFILRHFIFVALCVCYSPAFLKGVNIL